MKINEVTEDISNVQDVDHAIRRATGVAQMCKRLGKKPLLYREFEYKPLARDLIIKVDSNRSNQIGPRVTKTGLNNKQQEILQKLNIANPVFSVMKVPTGLDGGFGVTNIIIPLSNEMYWHPDIEDLGSLQYVGDEPRDPFKWDQTAKKTQQVADIKVDEIAAGYKQGWPTHMMDNEIILDTEEYYLINLGMFLKTYTGKPNKEMVKGDHSMLRFSNLKQELYSKKYKTYADIAWFLENPVINYIKWLHR
jgi:hypothetical protein